MEGGCACVLRVMVIEKPSFLLAPEREWWPKPKARHPRSAGHDHGGRLGIHRRCLAMDAPATSEIRRISIGGVVLGLLSDSLLVLKPIRA